MLQGYLLYFDIETIKVQAEVVQLHNENQEILDQELKKTLEADGYDFYDYSDEIAILVDDNGFLKPYNPIFEVISNFGDYGKLAGKLLFVRNIENEYSVDIDSISYEDIFNLRLKLQIQLIGMTKGD